MQAIIYAAKSTDDKRGSIKRQLEQCREMAEREGWSVVAEHADENKSGYHGSRGEGLVAAMAEAEELVPCVLLVHHSDRLARGDAKQAKHLVEYALWALKAEVTIRTVHDDDTFHDLASAAMMGQRNTEDSRIKGVRTAEGMRAVVEAGGWRGGTVPEGYEIKEELVDRVKQCTVVKRAEDEATFELIWKLALEGKSTLAISLELDRRGCMTSPRRKDRKPGHFTIRRVQATLSNCFYAGIQRWGKGESAEYFDGHWPRYVELEDFWRLKAERERRTSNRGGRPPAGDYLLSGLAMCGGCGGPVHAISSNRPRKNGSRARWYVCASHRNHAPGSPHRCPAPGWDAREVDLYALANVRALLGDADALARQLAAGQNAERKRREAEVEQAKQDSAGADARAERLEADYAATTDDTERAIALRQAKAAREEAQRARARMDAALDALDAEPEGDGREALDRMRESLARELGDADGDVKVMNAALRECFDAIFLKPGKALIAPVFKGEDLVEQILRGRELTPALRAALEALALPVD